MIINGFGGSSGRAYNSLKIARDLDGKIMLYYRPSENDSISGERAERVYNLSEAITIKTITVPANTVVSCNDLYTSGNTRYRYGIFKNVECTIPQNYYGVPGWFAMYFDVATTHSTSNIQLWNYSWSTGGTSDPTVNPYEVFYTWTNVCYFPPYNGREVEGSLLPSNTLHNSGGIHGRFLANYDTAYHYVYNGLGTFSASSGIYGGNYVVADETYASPTLNLMMYADNGTKTAVTPPVGTYTSLYAFTITVKFLPVRTYY